ncbi:hypothetical protein DFH11DRAFT_1818406 [Phellopilus nigrolimitatus]|nr:hypothetical protein DFH11DRAFT_1818406 [Phellopilus nigrolimitatus]
MQWARAVRGRLPEDMRAGPGQARSAVRSQVRVGHARAHCQALRTVAWAPAVHCILRRAILDTDKAWPPVAEKEPAGRRSYRHSVEDDRQTLLVVLNVNNDDSDNEEEHRLILEIRAKRAHASNDGMMEHQLEIVPAQLVRHTRPACRPSGNFSESPLETGDSDDEFDSSDEFDDDGCGCDGGRKKKRGGPKRPPLADLDHYLRGEDAIYNSLPIISASNLIVIVNASQSGVPDKKVCLFPSSVLGESQGMEGILRKRVPSVQESHGQHQRLHWAFYVPNADIVWDKQPPGLLPEERKQGFWKPVGEEDSLLVRRTGWDGQRGTVLSKSVQNPIFTSNMWITCPSSLWETRPKIFLFPPSSARSSRAIHTQSGNGKEHNNATFVSAETITKLLSLRQGSPPIRGFGVEFLINTAVVPGRPLSPTKVIYLSGPLTVPNGSWNTRDVRFHRLASLTRAAILVLVDNGNEDSRDPSDPVLRGVVLRFLATFWTGRSRRRAPTAALRVASASDSRDPRDPLRTAVINAIENEIKTLPGRPNIVFVSVCNNEIHRRLSLRRLPLKGDAQLHAQSTSLTSFNMFELGHMYLQLVQTFNLRLPLIDRSHYILLFAALLEFGDKMPKVSAYAVHVVVHFSSDICSACLLLAAHMNNFRRSLQEIVQVVKIADSTLKKRLDELKKIPSSALTLADFCTVWFEDEMDLPAFTKGKEREAKEREKERRTTKRTRGMTSCWETTSEDETLKERVWVEISKDYVGISSWCMDGTCTS